MASNIIVRLHAPRDFTADYKSQSSSSNVAGNVGINFPEPSSSQSTNTISLIQIHPYFIIVITDLEEFATVFSANLSCPTCEINASAISHQRIHEVTPERRKNLHLFVPEIKEGALRATRCSRAVAWSISFLMRTRTVFLYRAASPLFLPLSSFCTHGYLAYDYF